MAPLRVEKRLELLTEKEDPLSQNFQLQLIAGFEESHRQSLKWIDQVMYVIFFTMS